MLLTACGGGDSRGVLAAPSTSTQPAASAATATPAASTTAAAPKPTAPAAAAKLALQPDGGRILADIKYLAESIGPRPAGTPLERQAADFIADRLRTLGYDVAIQEFSVGAESSRTSTLQLQSPTARTVASAPFERTASSRVQGSLVFAGKGAPEEFPAAAKGAVVLLERGDLLFVDKVANAVQAGAIGVVVFNNEPGIFYGSLTRVSDIPAIAISQNEGRGLVDALSKGAITAEVGVTPLGDSLSRNVIAKPPGKDCETVSGGHFDSVQQAPGANDNASGTATVMEIASVMASKGEMGNNCFVLFGGEELGLNGSRAYVNSLDAGAKARLKGMLNFDMTGFGSVGWILIGSPSLQTKGLAIATSLGIKDAVSGGLPRSSSSDHASFIQAGIPALFFYRSEDTKLHTPQDTADRLNPLFLEQAAQMGVALLEQLSAGA